MLSKCLNPSCSATFQYLNQGRLFRIDFSEAARKQHSGSRQKPRAVRSKSSPLEHFWLCKECAQSMTVALDADGEVRVITLNPPVRGPSAVPVLQLCESYGVTAS
jgi:hypothetical protein